MAKKPAKPRPKVKAAAKKAARKAPKKAAKKATKPAAKPISAKKVTRKPRVNSQTARMELFVHEYLKANFNGSKAAIACGYSPASARFQASELLALPAVQERINEAIRERVARVAIDTDDVLRRMHAVATADARELTEVYHCCCRYCWGKNHRYQFTPRELEEAKANHATAQAEAQAQGKAPIEFSELGGIGFDPRRDPNQACPECFGRGEDVVVFKDTRDLSPSARLLYAGVKTTQHGMEVKTHDQMSMLVNVGKHLGMFQKTVQVSGKLTHQHESLSGILDAIDGLGTGLPDSGASD